MAEQAKDQEITSFEQVEPSVSETEFSSAGGGEELENEPEPAKEGEEAAADPDNKTEKSGETDENDGQGKEVKETEEGKKKEEATAAWKDGDKEYTPDEIREALDAKNRITKMLSAHMNRTNTLSTMRKALEQTVAFSDALRKDALDEAGEVNPDSTAGQLIDALREQGKDAEADALEKAVKAPPVGEFEDPREQEIEALRQENERLKLRDRVEANRETFKSENKLTEENMKEIENIGTEYFLKSCPQDEDGNPDLEKAQEMNLRAMPYAEAKELWEGRQARKQLEQSGKKAAELPDTQPPQKKAAAAGTKTAPIKSFRDIDPQIPKEAGE